MAIGGYDMSLEENKSIVRRYWEGFNAHDLTVWDDLCSNLFSNHDPGMSLAVQNLHDTKKHVFAVLLDVFPDIISTEEELLADGDKVVTRRTFTGTQQGEFMGMTATGRAVQFTGIFIDRLANGKIQEQWVQYDAMGLQHQVKGDYLVLAEAQAARAACEAAYRYD